MKSEKEFLESMWLAIEQEQADAALEQMIIEKNRRDFGRKVILMTIIACCLIFAITLTKVFNFAFPEAIIYLSSFAFIVIAFVIEKLTFKEVNNGN